MNSAMLRFVTISIVLGSSCFAISEVSAQTAKGAVASREGRRHALLIGIQNYELPQTQLQSPLADVRILGDLLKDQYGFTVTPLLDEKATREGILAAFRSLRQFGAKDTVVVFYAGHGHWRTEIDGAGKVRKEGYWIPWMTPSQQSNAGRNSHVVNAEIRKSIMDLNAGDVLLISDSCFSGLLTEGGTKGPGVGSRQFMTSGGDRPVNDRYSGGQSVFTYWLTTVLENHDLANAGVPLTAEQLFDSLAKHVRASSSQAPRYSRLRGNAQSFAFVRERKPKKPVRDPIKPGAYLPADYEFPEDVAIEVTQENGGFRFLSKKDRSEMLLVRRGRFTFGGVGKRKYIDINHPFLMDKFEVTVERYRQYLATHDLPSDMRLWNLEGYGAEDAKRPVVAISMHEASRFAEWAGKSLPTEYEWEYAAVYRPKTDSVARYPWDQDPRSGFPLSEIPESKWPPPVDQVKIDVSPWGIMGMNSGVKEWCVLPPMDREFASHGVIRGGSQVVIRPGETVAVDATERRRERAIARPTNVGFRCVVHLVKKPEKQKVN